MVSDKRGQRAFWGSPAEYRGGEVSALNKSHIVTRGAYPSLLREK